MTDTVRCPRCNALLKLPDEPAAGAFTCPRCLAEVTVPGQTGTAPLVPADGKMAPQGRPPTLDRDVRQDRRIVTTVLAVIGGAVLIWISIALVSGPGPWEPKLVLAGILGFLTLVSVFVIRVRTGSWKEARRPRRVAVGALALIGGIMVLGLASFMLLFAACMLARAAGR